MFTHDCFVFLMIITWRFPQWEMEKNPEMEITGGWSAELYTLQRRGETHLTRDV